MIKHRCKYDLHRVRFIIAKNRIQLCLASVVVQVKFLRVDVSKHLPANQIRLCLSFFSQNKRSTTVARVSETKGG